MAVHNFPSSTLPTTINNVDYISGMAGVFAGVFLYLTLVEEKALKRGLYTLFTFICYTMILTSTASSGFFTFALAFVCIIFLLFLTKNITLKKTLSISFIVLFLIVETAGFSVKNHVIWKNSQGPNASPTQVAKQVEGMSRDLLNHLSNQAYAKEPTPFHLPKLPKLGHSPLSGRTYIWKMTLELIQKKPLFGYGLDTFPYVFNQNAPSKYADFGHSYIIIDKPHNLFLDFAYGSGILSLFLFLLLIGIITVRFFRNMTSIHHRSNEQQIATALFIGMISFLIQGLVNDLVIGSGIIFWSLLGILGSYLFNQKRASIND